MKMQLPIHVPEEITIEDSASVSVSETVTDSQITVTKNDSCVPDSHMKFIVQKVAELLDSQGIPCCHCSKPAIYYLHYQPAKIYLIHLL